MWIPQKLLLLFVFVLLLTTLKNENELIENFNNQSCQYNFNEPFYLCDDLSLKNKIMISGHNTFIFENQNNSKLIQNCVIKNIQGQYLSHNYIWTNQPMNIQIKFNYLGNGTKVILPLNKQYYLIPVSILYRIFSKFKSKINQSCVKK